MNLEQARHNMIEQQIRPWEVIDSRVLNAMTMIPRDAFVAESQQAVAYADTQLPLGEGEVMMEPRVEGRMLQALAPQVGETALEIGTGSGYITALLASLAGSIRSIEMRPDFSEHARTRLSARKLGNFRLEVADVFSSSWDARGQYDVIAVTGAVREVPEKLLHMLAPNGRMFAVIGENVQHAVLMTRGADGRYAEESLFETALPYLQAPAHKPAFTF
jgi:protein-L-isoaspartate(D-aspartate) O-methyltransferase